MTAAAPAGRSDSGGIIAAPPAPPPRAEVPWVPVGGGPRCVYGFCTSPWPSEALRIGGSSLPGTPFGVATGRGSQ